MKGFKKPKIMICVKNQIREVRREYALKTIKELEQEKIDLLDYQVVVQNMPKHKLNGMAKAKVLFGIDIALNEILSIKIKKEGKL